MPELTEAENELLTSLTASNVLTLGKKRMKQVSAFAHRLMFLADKAEYANHNLKTMAHGLWLATCGKLSECEVINHPHLSDLQRDDLLTIIQLRYYAQAWCEQEGISLSTMPEVAIPSVQPNIPATNV